MTDAVRRLRTCDAFEHIQCAEHYAYNILPHEIQPIGVEENHSIEGVFVNGKLSSQTIEYSAETSKYQRYTMMRQVVFKLMAFLWKYGFGDDGAPAHKKNKRAKTTHEQTATTTPVRLDSLLHQKSESMDIESFAMFQHVDMYKFDWVVSEQQSLESKEYVPDRDDVYDKLIKTHKEMRGHSNNMESTECLSWTPGTNMMCLIEYIFDDGSEMRRPVEVNDVISKTFSEFILAGHYNVTCITFHWFLRKRIPENLLETVLFEIFDYAQQMHAQRAVRFRYGFGQMQKENGDDETEIVSHQSDTLNVDSETCPGDKNEIEQALKATLSVGKKRSRDQSLKGSWPQIFLTNRRMLTKAVSTLFEDDESFKFEFSDFILLLSDLGRECGMEIVKQRQQANALSSKSWIVRVDQWLSCELALSRRPRNCVPQQSFRHWVEHRENERRAYYTQVITKKTKQGKVIRRAKTIVNPKNPIETYIQWRRPPSVFFIQAEMFTFGRDLDNDLRILFGMDGFRSIFETLYPTIFDEAEYGKKEAQEMMDQTVFWMDEHFFSKNNINIDHVPDMYFKHAPPLSFAIVGEKKYLPTLVYAIMAASEETIVHTNQIGLDEVTSMARDEAFSLRNSITSEWDKMHSILTKSGHALASAVLDSIEESQLNSDDSFRTLISLATSTQSILRQSQSDLPSQMQKPVYDSFDGAHTLIMEGGATTQMNDLDVEARFIKDPQSMYEMKMAVTHFKIEVKKRYDYFKSALGKIQDVTSRLANSTIGFGHKNIQQLRQYLQRTDTSTHRYMLRYLKERSDIITTKLKEFISGSQVKPHFANVIRTIHRRDLLRSYERFARGENAEISDAQRIIDGYVKRTNLYAAENRVRLTKLDSSMDTLSNLRAILVMVYDCVYNCAAPATLDFLNLCALDASRIAYELHLNVLLAGPGAMHKSFLLDKIKELRIGEEGTNVTTTIEVTRETKQSTSVNSGAKLNGTVRIYHEAKASQFFGHGEDGTGDPGLKARLDHCLSRVSSYKIANPSSSSANPTDPSQEIRVAELIGVHMYATNASVSAMSSAMRERMIPIHMEDTKKEDFNTQHRMASEYANRGTIKMKKERCTRLHHFIQAVKSEIDNLIFIGAIQDVGMDLFAMVYMFIEQKLSDRGVPFLTSRMLKHTRALIRTICIQEVIAREFCFEGGLFVNADATPEVFAKLEPHLVVKMNHIVVGLGMILPKLFPPQLQMARRALRLIFLENFFEKGPKAVFSNSKFSSVTREQLISRGVFILDDQLLKKHNPSSDHQILSNGRIGEVFDDSSSNDDVYDGLISSISSKNMSRQERESTLDRSEIADHIDHSINDRQFKRFRHSQEPPPPSFCIGSDANEPMMESDDFESMKLIDDGNICIPQGTDREIEFDKSNRPDGAFRAHKDSQNDVIPPVSLNGARNMAEIDVNTLHPNIGTISARATADNPIAKELREADRSNGGKPRQYFPMDDNELKSFVQHIRLQDPRQRLVHDIESIMYKNQGDEKKGPGMGFDDLSKRVQSQMNKKSLFNDCSKVRIHIGKYGQKGAAKLLCKHICNRAEFSESPDYRSIDYALGILANTFIRARRYTISETVATSALLGNVESKKTKQLMTRSLVDIEDGVEPDGSIDPDEERINNLPASEEYDPIRAYFRLQLIVKRKLGCEFGLDAARRECVRIISLAKLERQFITSSRKKGTLKISRDPRAAAMNNHRTIQHLNANYAYLKKKINVGENALFSMIRTVASMNTMNCINMLRKRIKDLQHRRSEIYESDIKKAMSAIKYLRENTLRATFRKAENTTGLPKALGDRYHHPSDDILFFDSPMVDYEDNCIVMPTHWLMCDDFGDIEHLVLDALNEFCASKYQSPLRCTWNPDPEYPAVYTVVRVGRLKNVAPPRGSDVDGKSDSKFSKPVDVNALEEVSGYVPPDEQEKPLIVSRLNLMDDAEQLLLDAMMNASETSSSLVGIQSQCTYKNRSTLLSRNTAGTEFSEEEDSQKMLMQLNMSAELWATKRHNDRCFHIVQNVSHPLMILTLYGLQEIVNQKDAHASHRNRRITEEAFKLLDAKTDRSLIHCNYRVPRPVHFVPMEPQMTPDIVSSDDDESSKRPLPNAIPLLPQMEKRLKVFHWRLFVSAATRRCGLDHLQMASQYSAREAYLHLMYGMTPIQENRIDRCEVILDNSTINYPDALKKRYQNVRMIENLRHYGFNAIPSSMVESAGRSVSINQEAIDAATSSLHDLYDSRGNLLKDQISMQKKRQCNTIDSSHNIMTKFLSDITKKSRDVNGIDEINRVAYDNGTNFTNEERDDDVVDRNSGDHPNSFSPASVSSIDNADSSQHSASDHMSRDDFSFQAITEMIHGTSQPIVEPTRYKPLKLHTPSLDSQSKGQPPRPPKRTMFVIQSDSESDDDDDDGSDNIPLEPLRSKDQQYDATCASLSPKVIEPHDSNSSVDVCQDVSSDGQQPNKFQRFQRASLVDQSYSQTSGNNSNNPINGASREQDELPLFASSPSSTNKSSMTDEMDALRAKKTIPNRRFRSSVLETDDDNDWVEFL